MTRNFGWRSTALDVLKDMDLNGNTIVVTGASSGIGYETARALAMHNAHVVLACRNLKEAEEAKNNILDFNEDASVDVLHLDLSNLKTVESFAKEYQQREWPLNAIILNAGVYMPTNPVTVDGFETTFQINYLANFYLIKLLTPILIKSAPARIVHVSSSTHKLMGRFGPEFITWKNLSHERPKRGTFGAFAAYYRSKAMDKCAATSVYCAVAPELNNIGGLYYKDCKQASSNPSVENEETAKKLWDLSEEMLNKWKMST